MLVLFGALAQWHKGLLGMHKVVSLIPGTKGKKIAIFCSCVYVVISLFQNDKLISPAPFSHSTLSTDSKCYLIIS